MDFLEQQSIHDEEYSLEGPHANTYEPFSYEEVSRYAETHDLSDEDCDLINFTLPCLKINVSYLRFVLHKSHLNTSLKS
jgi:hypothetical protein